MSPSGVVPSAAPCGNPLTRRWLSATSPTACLLPETVLLSLRRVCEYRRCRVPRPGQPLATPSQVTSRAFPSCDSGAAVIRYDAMNWRPSAVPGASLARGGAAGHLVAWADHRDPALSRTEEGRGLGNARPAGWHRLNVWYAQRCGPLKESQAQLRSRKDGCSQMVAGVVHELNTLPGWLPVPTWRCLEELSDPLLRLAAQVAGAGRLPGDPQCVQTKRAWRIGA